MPKNIEQNDFKIENLNYNENQESESEKIEIVINDSSDFENIKTKYEEAKGLDKEKYLKALIHFADLFQEEAKLNIKEKIESASFPLEDKLIPKDLNKSIVPSMDHKMRFLINFLIEEQRFDQAKDLIEKTIRLSSYEGRKKKLSDILASQGLDYNDL